MTHSIHSSSCSPSAWTIEGKGLSPCLFHACTGVPSAYHAPLPPGEFSRTRDGDRGRFAPYPTIVADLLPRVHFWATLWDQWTRRASLQRRPLLRYVSTLCSHPAHIEKHGLIYPLAHPFWDEWLPPNSYPCSCVVMSVSLSVFTQRHATEDAAEWRIDVPGSALRYPHPDRGFRFNPGTLGPDPTGKATTPGL